MIQTVRIDLSQVSTKDELFEVFSQVFGFPSYFGKNWDAFEEIISDQSFEKIPGVNITEIHLILEGYNQFNINFPASEREIFESILTDILNQQKDSDKAILFTFEMK